MWYRLAQQNLTYQWQTTPEGDAIVFQSGKAKNGLPAYPTIFVLFKGEKDKYFDKQPVSQQISDKDLTRIIQTVQNVLFKYPPGWLIERAGKNFQVQVVAKITRVIDYDNYSKGENLGVTPIGPKDPYVTVSVDGITEALDHEIAHVFDELRYKSLPPAARAFLMTQKDGTYMAPTEYGKTNNTEAHSMAYEILAKKGIKWRFPNTSKEFIDNNRLLDFVAKEITQKGYKTQMQDFSDNIQLQSLKGKTQLENVDNLRISTLIGAFQNAIDKFTGDKNAYGFDLIKNKQKINDIVAFVNKNQTEFFVEPVSQEELKYSLDYIQEKLDKKDFSQNVVKENTLFTSSSSDIIEIGFLPRKIVEYLRNFKRDKENIFLANTASSKKPLDPQQRKNIADYMLTKISWEDLVNVDQATQELYNQIRLNSNKSLPNKALKINQTFYNLIQLGGIFPEMQKPEQFLFYDFKITPQGYTLDTNKVLSKIKQQLAKQKNFTEDEKLSMEKELFIMIKTYSERYKQLVEYKERDPKNPIPIEFMKNKFLPKDYLSLAKKAVDEILTNKSDPFSGVRTGQKFMQIYNNEFLNQNQKQELFNYYTSKRKRSTQR
jgi:hypothetical protein